MGRKLLPLLGAAILIAGYLGYCLGFAQRGQARYALTTETAASQAQLAQSPEEDEAEAETSSASLFPTGDGTEENGLIDINHADAGTLAQLPGVDEALAQAIIQYREENGIFVHLEELLNVPGMEQEIYDQMVDLIMVDYR